MSLFEAAEAENRRQAQPLALRMRPQTLAEFVGQQHFLGEGKLLHRLIKADRLSALLFYGPPGTGKTTLAHLLATETRCRFRQLNAVTSGVKDLRSVIDESRDVLATEGLRTLLFVDEIHRFNKTQQDALLPDVEDGTVVLVGATTSNPFFAVNSALVSRSRVFEFQPLSIEDITPLLDRALADRDRGLGSIPVNLHPDAARFLAETCDGDARQALSALEIGVLSSDDRPVEFTLELAAESVQRKAVQYDRDGDTHYDAISALIKSIRGSDPDAGIYWLARMLEGGEDVRFLARRLVILASEDVGNADPQALPLAIAAMQACEFVGLPECQLNLAQTVAYLACAPKSNAATVAIGEARADVREGRTVPVPVHLRDSHYTGAKQLGHGEGYEYAHSAEGGVAAQDYLGVEREYYRPVDRGFEQELGQRLEAIRAKLRSVHSPEEIGTLAEKTAVILVDHGSRRAESNDLLLEVVDVFRKHSAWSIVEPAHMELAEPSIATAFAQCVERGAELVIVFPYFLSPGRHWIDDIPSLAAEAAAPWTGVRYLVTAPLGLHSLMLQVIDQRIAACLARVGGDSTHCDLCDDSTGCTLLPRKT